MNNEYIPANSFGFFGKLPQHPDFIKHKASSEEFLLFDDWLQKGIASAKLKLGSEWKNTYNNSGYFDFIFPIKPYNKILLGVLNPSSDKSGRQFPFVIFSIMPDLVFNSIHPGSLPLILNSFFYRSKQLFISASKSTDLNQIITEFKNSEPRLNPALAAENIFNEYLELTSVKDFLDRTNLETNDDGTYVYADTHSLAISFNTDEDNNNFDTGFIINHFSVIYKQTGSIPFIFKTMVNDNSVILYLYFQKPEHSELARIISGTFTKAGFSKSLFNINNPDISLKEFLKKNQLH